MATKKGRDKQRLFVVEGTKWVHDAIAAGHSPLEIFATQQWATQPINQRFNVHLATDFELKEITQLTHHQQVIALMPVPEYQLQPAQLQHKLILVLDAIQDPGNLGTIIRLADWFGIEHLVCSHHTVDAYNPKVVQATMGALLRVKVYYTNLAAFFSQYKLLNQPVYGTFLSGQNIYTQPLSQTGAIVMGNEGQGISSEVAQYIDNQIFIPSFAVNTTHSESLNVATASAIALSEFRRRK